jgi:hypothetical protein
MSNQSSPIRRKKVYTSIIYETIQIEKGEQAKRTTVKEARKP